MSYEKVIAPATTKSVAPIVFASENDDCLQFYVENRNLNAVTIRDFCHLHCIEECIDSLREATVFSTLYATSGYWQIEIDESNHDKTAVTSYHGLYKFTRMLFGL